MKYTSTVQLSNENDSHTKIIKQVQPNSTILEFGCASGGMTKYLRNELNCKVYIVEIDLDSFNIAKEFAEKGICCDIMGLKWLIEFQNIAFDYVIFSDVLEHLLDPNYVLKEVKGLLKDTGRILVSLPNIAHNDVLKDLYENEFNYSETGILDKTHIRFFAYKNLLDFFKNSGYSIESIDYIIKESGLVNLSNNSLTKLLNERKLGNIFQFIVVLQKSEVSINDFNMEIDVPEVFLKKIYFDYGLGFTESDVMSFTNDAEGEFNFNFTIPAGVRNIRFDPIENQLCYIKNLNMFTSTGKMNWDSSNGRSYEEYLLFETLDPQIIYSFNNSVAECRAIIQGEIHVFNEAFQYNIISDLISKNLRLISEVSYNSSLINKSKEQMDLLKNRLEDVEKIVVDQDQKILKLHTDLEKQCIKIAKLNSELEVEVQKVAENVTIENNLKQNINALKNEVNYLAHNYNLIKNSKSWKILKPYRIVADSAKKGIKKINNICNRFKNCLIEHGMRYTLKLLLKKLFKKNRENIISINTNQIITDIDYTQIDESIAFSVLLPLYNTPINYLKSTIESVLNQTYTNWELCIADGSNENEESISAVCSFYLQNSSKIKYVKINNLGISENSNAAASLASKDYFVLLDHDDLLAPSALFHNARAISMTNAEVLYSDEDHLNPLGVHVNPFFKPDWSIDLLMSQMYICHLFVFKKELFYRVGKFRKIYDGSQDYDLMLRFSLITEKIVHIPQILYSWRESSNSTAVNPNAKPYAQVAGLNALNDYLLTKYNGGAIAYGSKYTYVYDVRYSTLEKLPKVSIIIPIKDNLELTKVCVDSILNSSTYSNYEILILDNNSNEQKTKDWLHDVRCNSEKILVFDAFFPFNWSKLNNFGMRNATGEVFIFLNNDTKVINSDWIERLAENALRDDIGVVGAQLLYDDDTLQHAGVVVGLNGYADHIFKGQKAIHKASPYVSPEVNRNVTAVTGACMAISKSTFSKIGEFNEEFIICGSDVEICIRAYNFGLNNLYNSRVKLYHFESKSRDSYIPEIDFLLSNKYYSPFVKFGDPYFNVNLSITDVIPKKRSDDIDMYSNFKNFLKRNKMTNFVYKRASSLIKENFTSYEIPEIVPMIARITDNQFLRYNLIIPSVNKEHVFGGIATALKFFNELVGSSNYSRIIVTDSIIDKNQMVDLPGYQIIPNGESSMHKNQIVEFSNRVNQTIEVGEKDIFVATAWWTAYNIFPVLNWQNENYQSSGNSLIYLIQDYEPGFYPWSSRYLMAESTYKTNVKVHAVFNSKELCDFFQEHNYNFTYTYSFEPKLNDDLREYLVNHEPINRKKQILIYGRPSTQRNAFELSIIALKKWAEIYPESKNWTIYSVGEKHADVQLSDCLSVRSLGKLSLEEYAHLMSESYLGVSLMVSPHPSYPPLEMATFGMKVITNRYENKNLSQFSTEIYSLENCSDISISILLRKLCDNFEVNEINLPEVNSSYFMNDTSFHKICNEIEKINN